MSEHGRTVRLDVLVEPQPGRGALQQRPPAFALRVSNGSGPICRCKRQLSTAWWSIFRAAKALGLTVPPALIATATEVIEQDEGMPIFARTCYRRHDGAVMPSIRSSWRSEP